MAVYRTVAVHMLVAEGQEYQLSVWAKASQALTTRIYQATNGYLVTYAM